MFEDTSEDPRSVEDMVRSDVPEPKRLAGLVDLNAYRHMFTSTNPPPGTPNKLATNLKCDNPRRLVTAI